MEFRKRYFFIVFLFIFLVGVVGILSVKYIQPKNNQNQKSVLAVTKDSYNLAEFNKETFDNNIYKAKTNPYPISEKIAAAIIPHHDIAGFLIADLYQKAASQGIKKVILIGPNHEELGASNILTTDSNWLTPGGIVPTNSEIINGFLAKKLVIKDLKAFEKEQSIFTHTPYIKTFLPNAEIVPIILKKNITHIEEENFINQLIPYIDEQTLIVGSVDFSHYLDKNNASQKDDETIELIKSKSLTQLHSLSSEHLDSAPTISVIMQLMDSLGKKNLKVLEHLNSDDIQGIRSTSTTSYFYIIFH